MKKILLAFDGCHFSEGAFEFARTLNDASQVLLTGVFSPLIDYSGLWSYSVGVGATVVVPTLEDDDADAVEKNIDRFVFLCQLHNIEYRVHKDFSDFALQALKKESRFADLLILGSESFYANTLGGDGGTYLKEAVHSVECPVLVVPEKFIFPKNNVLAYDGSESSVYAIKQFAYLFPELTANNTLLVYVHEGEEDTFPEEDNIKELCARHYTALTLFRLDLNPKKYFGLWANEREGALLVSGAFGRSSLSRAFSRSFVDEIVRERKLPLFITHQ